MRDILGERDGVVPDTPTRVAEPSRESQLPKRFYKSVATQASDSGFVVELDGKTVNTPGKKPLSVSTEPLAEVLVEEWSNQKERIDPMTMPMTRLVNTAIDGVATDMQAVKEDIIRYSGTDLLCYRVEAPEGLVERQLKHWDPMMDWAQMTLGARFDLAGGIMHVEQPAEAIAAFSTHVGTIDDPLALAATHVATTLTGSAILAMAVVKGHLDAEKAWQLAHLDESWNEEQWGVDEEAAARRATRFIEMRTACFVLAELG